MLNRAAKIAPHAVAAVFAFLAIEGIGVLFFLPLAVACELGLWGFIFWRSLQFGADGTQHCTDREADWSPNPRIEADAATPSEGDASEDE